MCVSNIQMCVSNIQMKTCGPLRLERSRRRCWKPAESAPSGRPAPLSPPTVVRACFLDVSKVSLSSLIFITAYIWKLNLLLLKKYKIKIPIWFETIRKSLLRRRLGSWAAVPWPPPAERPQPLSIRGSCAPFRSCLHYPKRKSWLAPVGELSVIKAESRVELSCINESWATQNESCWAKQKVLSEELERHGACKWLLSM